MNSRRPILGRKGPDFVTFMSVQSVVIPTNGRNLAPCRWPKRGSLPGMTVLGFRSNIVSGLGRPKRRNDL